MKAPDELSPLIIKITDSLRQSQRWPQAILLQGTDAQMLFKHCGYWLKQMFCRQRSSACGQCGVCEGIHSRKHRDIIWSRAESKASMGIDIVKEIQDHLQYFAAREEQSPASQPAYRIAVIEDIDRMTLQAANRLLKTLEEPPPHSVIIATTTASKSLLATIRSRFLGLSVKSSTQNTYLEELCAPLREYDAKGPLNLGSFSELWAKSSTPNHILRHTEVLANQSYRRTFGIPMSLSTGSEMGLSRDFDWCSRAPIRRLRLRQLKDLIWQKKISINAQLVLEELLSQES